MPAISPANSVSTSQMAIAASAAVAARRQTTDSSSGSASHSAMYTTATTIEGDDARDVAARRADAEAQRAVAGDDRDEAGEGEGDGADAGDELAVDDLVAVDRLGDTSRGSVRWARSPLIASNPKAMPSSGPRMPRNSWNAGTRCGRQREQVEEDRRRLRRRVGGVADRAARRVHGGQPGERDEDDEDHEADRADVVGELLAGDDAPAAGVAARRVGAT